MSWSALGDWLEAADPGALRVRHALRVALASLTAWLAMHLLIPWLAGRPMPSVGLFAVTVCFIDALVIVDARRAARRLTLLLSLAMFALGLVLASLLRGQGPLYMLVLLALIFVAYAIRRHGLRPGELALVLTMGLYFTETSQVTSANLAWFGLAACAGVGSLWLWQFVLLPYDPTQALRSGVRAFYRGVASMVGPVAAELNAPLAPADATRRTEGLQRQLRQAKLSRRVIEDQFPGVLAPGGWTQFEIEQMRVALYGAERGTAQLVEGARDRSHLAAIPVEIRTPLANGLSSLEAALNSGSPERVQALATENAVLQAQVQAYARRASAAGQGAADAPLAPWVSAALRLAGGALQVAGSVAQVRAIAAHQAAPNTPRETRPDADGGRNGPGLPPLVPVLGKFHLHPTTILGIQAVLATGLALLVARLLNVDHSNAVYWTAFVVIAGSTGESLRKMMLRVAGTVAGATIGVALALSTPDNTALVVLAATGCLFLSIYFWPVSYPLMVFWLNIGLVSVYTLLGASLLGALVGRPLTALLGALVAALVVVFVFPIHTADRFKAAVTRFLAAVDGYVACSVDAMIQGDDPEALGAAGAKVTATYAQVEQTLPAVAFENNPLLQAESPLTQRGTQIAALEAEVARLAGAANERAALDGDAGDADWLRVLQARIHSDIQALIGLLGNGNQYRRTRASSGQLQSAAPPARASWGITAERLAERLGADGGPGQARTSGELALIRMQGMTAQLLAELGGEYATPSI